MALTEPGGPLAALQYREFRLFWMGQALSLVGSRMQAAALIYHLYQLTHDPAALGSIGLARLIPLLVFALVGGAVADVADRRRLLIVSQFLLGGVAVALGAWSITGLHVVWPIYAVAALNAGVAAFDGPARQSLIPALVPRDRLRNAVSLNSITSQVASIVGPTLMGLLIAQYNFGVVYLVNAASFVTVILALSRMRPPARVPADTRPQVNLASIVEGLRYVRGSRLLLSLMVLDFLATFFASATTLLPIYAAEILKVGPQGYGRLVAAPSVGSLIAALGMALLPRIRRQGKVVLVAVFAYGLATVLFGMSDSFGICFLALAGTGAADTVSTVLRATIRQLVTPDELRGRMTSVNMLFVQGGPQLGEMEAGYVARWFGVTPSVISGGLACMVTALAMAVAAPGLRRYKGEE